MSRITTADSRNSKRKIEVPVQVRIVEFHDNCEDRRNLHGFVANGFNDLKQEVLGFINDGKFKIEDSPGFDTDATKQIFALKRKLALRNDVVQSLQMGITITFQSATALELLKAADTINIICGGQEDGETD